MPIYLAPKITLFYVFPTISEYVITSDITQAFTRRSNPLPKSTVETIASLSRIIVQMLV